MKDEYDFSTAERGKFYNSEANLHLPVYLDDDVHAYLTRQARNKNVEVNTIVNDLLRKDIDMIEGAK